jgi:MBG domain (YGX type)
VPGILTVTQAFLTVTANNASKTLGAPNPTFSWTASGFVNGDTASVFTTSPACSTTATASSSVGTYPITCTGAAAMNYSFSYVPGTLTVLAEVCHYVSIALSPTDVAPGGTITVHGHLMSCASTTQIIVEEFSLAGPLKPGTCEQDETVMFKTPPFPLPPKVSQSLSFPFPIPERSCAGNFTITATTLVNGKVVDTSSSQFTVTAN